jgi:hypothetical protein
MAITIKTHSSYTLPLQPPSSLGLRSTAGGPHPLEGDIDVLGRDWQHEIPLKAGLVRRVAHGSQIVAQSQVGCDHLNHGEGDALSGTPTNAHAMCVYSNANVQMCDMRGGHEQSSRGRDG